MIRILVWVAMAAALASLLDLLARRIGGRGECGLHRALVLRDSCVGRCPPGKRCVALQTRRHWLLGTQAAGCGCIEAREGGGPVSPPDIAELPRPEPGRGGRPDDGPGPVTPEPETEGEDRGR